ncbi:hypothetical protein NM208_g14303 [Fusarium decemcellulare]|uniref:Uncharacterized protein n=1 Tax=Fusarium decemcellulare TaxID=57161 RepID=A0ACC1RID1_9HYPO|nr:hypothetical protein NM208_g14303 [Fusarium decemcellulare]
MNTPANPPGFDMPYGGQRNEQADSGVSAFPQFNQGMMYNAPGGPMPANLQQMQYQQMMNRGPPPMGYNFPPMQAGYGGFNGPNPSVDQYRQQNMPNGSPIQPPVSQMPQMPAWPDSLRPPGFGMGMGNYGYGNMGGMPNMGYMQQEQGNPRRGRVRQPQSRNGQPRRGG